MPQLNFQKKYQAWVEGAMDNDFFLTEFDTIAGCLEFVANNYPTKDFYLTKRVNFKEVVKLDVTEYVDDEDAKILGARGGSKKWEGKTEQERKDIMAEVRKGRIDKDK